MDEHRERFADAVHVAAIGEEALDVFTAEGPARVPLTAELAMAYRTAEGACPSQELRRW